MYEKDIRILRFDILEHLQTMIETQEQHMEGIYSSYKPPIEEREENYPYSIICPLHQLLENVRAADKLKSVRYLLRLQWRVDNDQITDDANYKMFLELISNTKTNRLEQENID